MDIRIANLLLAAAIVLAPGSPAFAARTNHLAIAPNSGPSSLGNAAGGAQIHGEEMADCLDDADAQGLGPKSALQACFELVLTPDGEDQSFPADPDTSD